MEDSFGVEEIQNIVYPCEEAEERTVVVEEEEKNGEANKEESAGGEGNENWNWKLPNLISSIIHQDQGGTDGEGKQPEEAKVSDEHMRTEIATGGGGGGGGGGPSLVESLMSSLTSPLLEDAAPATDEACILIHSIVHD